MSDPKQAAAQALTEHLAAQFAQDPALLEQAQEAAGSPPSPAEVQARVDGLPDPFDVSQATVTLDLGLPHRHQGDLVVLKRAGLRCLSALDIGALTSQKLLRNVGQLYTKHLTLGVEWLETEDGSIRINATEQMMRGLPWGDRRRLGIALHDLLTGHEGFTSSVQCVCRDTSEFTIPSSVIEYTPVPETIELLPKPYQPKVAGTWVARGKTASGYEATFRIADGYDEERQYATENAGDLDVLQIGVQLARDTLIEFHGMDVASTPQFWQRLAGHLMTEIRELQDTLSPGPDLAAEVECPTCRHKNFVLLDITVFSRARSNRRRGSRPS